MCVFGGCAHECEYPWWAEGADPLELELHAVVSHLTWMLEINSGPLAITI